MQLLTTAQASKVRLIGHNKITYKRQTIPEDRFCLHRTSGKGSHTWCNYSDFVGFARCGRGTPLASSRGSSSA